MKIEGFSTSRKKNKQKLNWIRLAEHGRIPAENVKYTNPRIKYDGINWWITTGIEYKASAAVLSNEGIGIDLGIKYLAVCSDKKNTRILIKHGKLKN